MLTVLPDEGALAAAAADRIAALVASAIGARERALVCLTGGSTPRRLYAALGDPAQPWRSRLDWSRVHVYWGDERHGPPDHADSNFGMANGALVAHVPIPPGQVHRMRGELADAHEAAAEYNRLLPRDPFDVMLLGLGDDAHIASLFPGSPLLGGSGVVSGSRGSAAPDAGDDTLHGAGTNGAAAVWAPHLQAWRITLTPTALLHARQILMLVSGEAKADAVRAALEFDVDPRRWPAQLLRGAPVEWLIDRAAARRLHASPPA